MSKIRELCFLIARGETLQRNNMAYLGSVKFTFARISTMKCEFWRKQNTRWKPCSLKLCPKDIKTHLSRLKVNQNDVKRIGFVIRSGLLDLFGLVLLGSVDYSRVFQHPFHHKSSNRKPIRCWINVNEMLNKCWIVVDQWVSFMYLIGSIADHLVLVILGIHTVASE